MGLSCPLFATVPAPPLGPKTLPPEQGPAAGAQRGSLGSRGCCTTDSPPFTCPGRAAKEKPWAPHPGQMKSPQPLTADWLCGSSHSWAAALRPYPLAGKSHAGSVGGHALSTYPGQGVRRAGTQTMSCSRGPPNPSRWRVHGSQPAPASSLAGGRASGRATGGQEPCPSPPHFWEGSARTD